jgi:hypothetical protein
MTSNGLRASGALAALARAGIDSNREALAEMSDLLGVALRQPTARGLGNRRWSAADLAVLAAAFRLRQTYGISAETLAALRRGEVDPAAVIHPLADLLAQLTPGRQITAA